MTAIDTLLRQANSAPVPVPGLQSRVLQAVSRHAERKETKALLRWGALLCAAAALGLWLLSTVIVDILETGALDVVGIAAEDPSLLTTSVGWLALADTVPLLGIALTAMSVAAAAISLRHVIALFSHPLPSPHVA